VFILYIENMKKLLCLFISLPILLIWFSCICLAGKDPDYKPESERNFEQSSPVGILEQVKNEANKKRSEEIQNTDLDNVTSTWCIDTLWDRKGFTITRTLCNIRMNIKSYLQYVVYLWLSAATIFIIRNGFRLVMAEDRGSQMKTFGKNILKILIWVILLVWFYYIIDIFTSVVNYIAD